MAMRCISGNIEMTRRHFVAMLTAMYSRKLPNSNFDGDTPKAECFAHAEEDFLSARKPDL
jgi:hypothetical protein